MDSKDLVERFKIAFEQPEKIHAEEYQKIVEANATKAADNAERLTFMLLGLVMVFILIIQGNIKKLDLGFTVIDDPSIILFLIPVLIAYIQYDLITTLSKFDQLAIIHKVIIGRRHPPIHSQKLTKYFLSLPTIYENKNYSKEGVVGWMQSRLWFIEFFLITVVIPFGSEIIAFGKFEDISTPGYSFLLLTSKIVTIMLNAQSTLTIITLFLDVKE